MDILIGAGSIGSGPCKLLAASVRFCMPKCIRCPQETDPHGLSGSCVEAAAKRCVCVQCIVYASRIQGLPDIAMLQSLLETHQAICTQAAGAALAQAPQEHCELLPVLEQQAASVAFPLMLHECSA